jgi:hypothetical protein
MLLIHQCQNAIHFSFDYIRIFCRRRRFRRRCRCRRRRRRRRCFIAIAAFAAARPIVSYLCLCLCRLCRLCCLPITALTAGTVVTVVTATHPCFTIPIPTTTGTFHSILMMLVPPPASTASAFPPGGISRPNCSWHPHSCRSRRRPPTTTHPAPCSGRSPHVRCVCRGRRGLQRRVRWLAALGQ